MIERLGDVGRKLHTARSRNDQVVTDLKLWMRDAIDAFDIRLLELQRSFLDFAEREQDVVIPGYTHMQRAQPVLAAHYFLAYVEKFQRDRDRLPDCRKRVNMLPLGAAALAGTSLPIDRHSVARQLGFDAVARNSLDVSSDRDFVVEFSFCLSLIAMHLSTWAEEWILWSTTEFNFIRVARFVLHRFEHHAAQEEPGRAGTDARQDRPRDRQPAKLLILLKGLPMAYNRDLQEDKPALFDSHDTVASTLEVAAPLVKESRLRREVIADRLEDGFLDATTLMEWSHRSRSADANRT